VGEDVFAEPSRNWTGGTPVPLRIAALTLVFGFKLRQERHIPMISLLTELGIFNPGFYKYASPDGLPGNVISPD
jgi:hypothetical protein